MSTKNFTDLVKPTIITKMQVSPTHQNADRGIVWNVDFESGEPGY